MTVLGAVSRLVPDALLARLLPSSSGFDSRVIAPVPRFDAGAEYRLVIGPENSAGQGARWARAIEAVDARVSARCLAVDRGAVFRHEADTVVLASSFAWSGRWQRSMRQRVASEVTHVLIESGRPILAGGSRGSLARDLRWFAQRGIAGGFVWHGSDVRDPDRHAAEHPFSPYRDAMWASVPELRASSRRNRNVAASTGLPSFVSTPDLLVDVPGARWLPIVVDAPHWRSLKAPLHHGGPLRVVHAPSRDVIKGTALVEPVLHELHERGVIQYRRLQGIPHGAMPEAVRNADVVLDQFRLGSYGVAAAEGMAAGRIVIGDVSADVRAAVQRRSGLEPAIIDTRPDHLSNLLTEIARDPRDAVALAAQGPGFVAAVHDGRLSASVLARWIEGVGDIDGAE